jgi:hypothetical protein
LTELSMCPTLSIMDMMINCNKPKMLMDKRVSITASMKLLSVIDAAESFNYMKLRKKICIMCARCIPVLR